MDDSPFVERALQLGLATVYFAGVVVAFVIWPKRRLPATLLLIAASLSLAVELGYIAAWTLPEDADETDLFTILLWIDLGVRSIAFVLLILAIVAGTAKDRPRRALPFDDLDDDA
jgi:hypothetical protein